MFMRIHKSNNQSINHKMKTIKQSIITVLLIAGFIFAGNANALDTNYQSDRNDTVKTVQADKDLFKKMEEAIVYSLKSENSGVLESIIYNTVEFKVKYPGFKSVAVENALIQTVREGNNHTIRYKAFLALSYLKNQNKFDTPEKLAEYLNVKQPNRIFTYIDDKLRADQLASR